MALPPTIPCKVSSEAAGYVSMTAVARVNVPLEDLIAKILGVCGKDLGRIAGVLARGSLVSADSRYRWQAIRASQEDLAALVDRFPDHDPERAFDGRRCTHMTFRSGRGDLEISREAGIQRRLFRRMNFWDEALLVVSGLAPRCDQYSYSEEADVFVATLTPDARSAIRALSGLLRFTLLGARIRALDAHGVILNVQRE